MGDRVHRTNYEELRRIVDILEPVVGLDGDPSPAQMVDRAKACIEALELEVEAMRIENADLRDHMMGNMAKRIEALTVERDHWRRCYCEKGYAELAAFVEEKKT